MRIRRGSVVLAVLIVALGGGIYWLNLAPFRFVMSLDRPYYGMSKDRRLEYLPGPQVSRLLAFGHTNTVSRLWWISSYRYFNYCLDLPLDERTDLLAEHRGSFRRLYDALIALDPEFVPFYHYGAMTTGSVVMDAHAQLRFLSRGVFEHPDDLMLWRNLTVVLSEDFNLERDNPDALFDVLIQWAERETNAGDESVGRTWAQAWIQAMARRRAGGLGQLTYWGDVLRVSSPASPQGRLAERTLREQYASYGVKRLQELADAYRVRHDRAPAELADLLDPDVLRAVYGVQARDLGPEPLAVVDDRVELRSDPYGWPYRIEEGQISSRGLAYAAYERWLEQLNRRAVAHGWPRLRKPEDLARWPFGDREQPSGVRIAVHDGRAILDWPEPPGEPWSRLELIRSADLPLHPLEEK